MTKIQLLISSLILSFIPVIAHASLFGDVPDIFGDDGFGDAPVIFNDDGFGEVPDFGFKGVFGRVPDIIWDRDDDVDLNNWRLGGRSSGMFGNVPDYWDWLPDSDF